MKTRAMMALALCCLLLVALTGCQQAAEKAFEQATGVKVDEDGDSVTVTGEDGEEIEVQSGSNTLPDDFPDDFPTYESGDIESSMSMSTGDGTMYTVSIVTNDAHADVFEWHKTEVVKAGWTIEGEYSLESDGTKSGQLTLKKGERDGYVNVTEQGDGTVMVTSQVMEP